MFQHNSQQNPSRNDENPAAKMIKARSPSRFRSVTLITRNHLFCDNYYSLEPREFYDRALQRRLPQC